MASGDSPPPPTAADANGSRKKRKMINCGGGNQVPLPLNGEEEVLEEEEDDDESFREDAKPVGDVVRVSGTGESTTHHFNGFEVGGTCYELEDIVLISPEEYNMNIKPSVAIIKDITTMKDGKIIINGQRFYRPEVVEKENRVKWESGKARELFYSFDKSQFPADSIMHKCQVHFIPPNKKIPSSKEHPGFIVRKVYDANSKKLSKLLDTSYEEYKQHEINILVQKTIARISSWNQTS